MEEFSSVVSAKWLFDNINHADVVILDATIPKAGTNLNESLKKEGIPTARFFDLKNKFSTTDSPFPNTMPSEEQFENEARILGINNESIVIIYDLHGIYSSARAWWMFRAMGHDNVAILDGGFPEWVKENNTSLEIQPYTCRAGNFTAKYDPSFFVSSNEVLNAVETETHLILDARAEDRFYGKTPEPRAELRSGHIPKSISMHYARVIDNGKLKSKNQLAQLFSDSTTDKKPLIMSCGSGITACILALAAEMTGNNKISVFDGSWSEWGGSHFLPVEQTN